ncbi:MAG: sulfotransferase domain-containing protein, partial [Nostoc sp.]|uniref:sulfotransferase domain-containing protein n=1 Tax=Nostoc sp. TaxID=1180 RepID=UPI002FF4C7F9
LKNQQIKELQNTFQESQNHLVKEIDLKNQQIEELQSTSQELQNCLKIIQNFNPLINKNFSVFISDNYYPLAWHKKGQTLHKVFIASIPKSGTYLYSLLLKSMGVEQTNMHLSEIGFSDYRFTTPKQAREDYFKLTVNIPLNESLKLISPGQFAVGHLPYSQNVVELLKDFKIIFVYRDLRDAVVSHMHFFSHPGRGQLDSAWKLREDGPEKLLTFMKLYKEMFLNLYIPMIDWVNEKDICKVSFEELYGDYGAEVTYKTIDKIKDYLELPETIIDYKGLLTQVMGVETTTWSGQRTNRNLYWNKKVSEYFVDLGLDTCNQRLGY